ncbi:hypothetical protein D9M70_558460 [compost metagenome]
MGKVVGAIVGVISDNQCAGFQTVFHQIQHLVVEGLGAIEQQQIDRLGKTGAQGLERIAFPDFDKVDKAAVSQVLACP